MKKVILMLICLLSLQVFSQKQEVGPEIEECRGWNKILVLKSNFTFHVELTSNDGVNVTLYNTNRKIVSSGVLNLSQVKKRIGFTVIPGVYEISEDVVIFFQTIENQTPTLIRVIVDGKTGQLKSEEKVTELDKITLKSGYALAYGDVDYPTVKVEKDPDSDFYVVIRYNTLADETKNRIEILHYNPQHKIINKANYLSPNDKYKYTKYLSAYVKKDEFVLIGTYAFNTKKSGGEEARFYVSKLLKGKTNFIQKELPYKDFYKGASCAFIYNKPLNIINMILFTDADYKKNQLTYDIVFQNIDIETMALKPYFKADFTTINAIYKGKMQRKEGFDGLIQGAYVDKLGNLIILYQNTKKFYGYNSPTPQAILGDVALVKVNSEGKIINTAVFPCSIFKIGFAEPLSYNNFKKGIKEQGECNGLANAQNFCLDFIATENAEYVLFNNSLENMNKADTEEAKAVKAISKTAAVKYTFKQEDLRKEYLFGEPKDKKDNEFCNFGASDYSKETKTYATLVTNPKTKKTSLIWLKLD